jgi:hypothetical protein
MGEAEWQIARVLEGRPAVGAELGDDYNPLEAGLGHAVSLNKVCAHSLAYRVGSRCAWRHHSASSTVTDPWWPQPWWQN